MEEKSFIDRKEEFLQLKSALSAQGHELIILYGRRRIGKSRLLRELNRAGLLDAVIMLEDADYRTNLGKCSARISELFHFPSFNPQTFRELFSSLPDGCRIALDEFSYIPGATGEFQAIIEETLKPKNIKLVLSGSFIRVMEDLNYSLSSPLYGRATQIVKLTEFGFSEFCEWFQAHKNPEDLFKAYFSIGGVPKYLEIIGTPDIPSIESSFFSKNGFLLREGKLLLKESFPSSQLMPKVLMAISQGKSDATGIANAVGLKANEIGKYLSLLADYGYIEKRYPVLGGGKKDVRFYSSDNFFSFWSRFVWPDYSEIESGSDTALKRFRNEFSQFCGLQFEKTVLQIAKLSKIPDYSFERIGRQWGRTGKSSPSEGRDQYEIDLCGTADKKKLLFLGECKWQDKVNPKLLAKGLIAKAEFAEWNMGSRKLELGLFAKSFREKITDCQGIPVKCFDLKDLVAITRE